MLLTFAFLSCTLFALSTADFLVRRLPDFLTGGLIAAGLVRTAWVDGGQGTLGTAAAGLVGFATLWAIARLYIQLRGHRGLGRGDAKLLAAAGAWMGPTYLAPIVFVGAVLALLYVLGLRIVGRAITAVAVVPFGPFLSAAFFGFWCLKVSGWLVL